MPRLRWRLLDFSFWTRMYQVDINGWVVCLRGGIGYECFLHTDGEWRQTLWSREGMTGRWTDGYDWRGKWCTGDNLAERALNIWIRHLPQHIWDERSNRAIQLRPGKRRGIRICRCCGGVNPPSVPCPKAAGRKLKKYKPIIFKGDTIV
jgi:hypothetical protein